EPDLGGRLVLRVRVGGDLDAEALGGAELLLLRDGELVLGLDGGCGGRRRGLVVAAGPELDRLGDGLDHPRVVDLPLGFELIFPGHGRLPGVEQGAGRRGDEPGECGRPERGAGVAGAHAFSGRGTRVGGGTPGQTDREPWSGRRPTVWRDSLTQREAGPRTCA